MATRKAESVPGVTGLYVRRGVRKATYFSQTGGQYHGLGNDLEEAKRKLRKLLGQPALDGTITAMCRGFIREQRELLKAGDKNALGSDTIDDYEMCLEKNVLPVFGHMAPGEFKPAHGARYLAMKRKGDPENGVKPTPVRANRDMAALASAFHYGMREGMFDGAHPLHGVRRNKERPRQRRVTVKELNTFLEHAKQKGGSSYMVALIGLIVALAGRRRASILQLPKSAITSAGLRGKEAKRKPGEPVRTFTVKWSPTLKRLAEEAAAIPRRKPSDYLFPTNDGTPYKDTGFKTLWNRLMHSFAPEGSSSPAWFRAHDLRALYVTEMLAQGRNPKTHKSERTMRSVYDRNTDIEVDPLA